jgi:Flp pilus assembly protein TadG
MARLRNILAGTTGAEIAEAAIVLPIVLMLLLGIFAFGQAFNIYETVNHAAVEAARAVVAPTCATCVNNNANPTCPTTTNCPLSPNQVAQIVQASLQASHLDPTLVQQNSLTPSACAGTGNAPTGCSSPTSGGPNICVYYNVQLGVSTGPALCGTIVTFQYPYTFYLPLLSVSQHQIKITALAQMRGDY